MSSIVTHHLKDLIDELIFNQVTYTKISELLATRHQTHFTPEQIEEYATLNFDREQDVVYAQAARKQKAREIDLGYETGQQSIQNSVMLMNYLLEQVTQRWKIVTSEVDENQKTKVTERELIQYVREIRETAKMVHELNKEIKDDNYIPIEVFYQEVDKIVSIVMDFLVVVDREAGGNFRARFEDIVRDRFSELVIEPTSTNKSIGASGV